MAGKDRAPAVLDAVDLTVMLTEKRFIMLKKLTYVFLMLMLPFIGMGDVFLWSVNETATVDGQDIRTYLVPYTVDDDNWNAIRIKIIDGNNSTIMDIWGEDEFGNPERWDGEWGVELGETGANSVWGEWGTVWNQSPFEGSLSSTALIQAELLRCSFDADTPTVLAISEAMTLQYMIENDKYYTEGSIAPDNFTPYNFTTFNSSSVPEPSSTLLALIGISFLGLKRKMP